MHEIYSKTAPEVDFSQVKRIEGFATIQAEYSAYLSDESKLSAKPSAVVTFDQSVELNKLQHTWPGVVTSSTNSFLISDDDPLLTQNIFDWAVTHRYKIQELKWVDNKIEDVFHEQL